MTAAPAPAPVPPPAGPASAGPLGGARFDQALADSLATIEAAATGGGAAAESADPLAWLADLTLRVGDAPRQPESLDGEAGDDDDATVEPGLPVLLFGAPPAAVDTPPIDLTSGDAAADDAVAADGAALSAGGGSPDGPGAAGAAVMPAAVQAPSETAPQTSAHAAGAAERTPPPRWGQKTGQPAASGEPVAQTDAGQTREPAQPGESRQTGHAASAGHAASTGRAASAGHATAPAPRRAAGADTAAQTVAPTPALAQGSASGEWGPAIVNPGSPATIAVAATRPGPAADTDAGPAAAAAASPAPGARPDARIDVAARVASSGATDGVHASARAGAAVPMPAVAADVAAAVTPSQPGATAGRVVPAAMTAVELAHGEGGGAAIQAQLGDDASSDAQAESQQQRRSPEFARLAAALSQIGVSMDEGARTPAPTVQVAAAPAVAAAAPITAAAPAVPAAAVPMSAMTPETQAENIGRLVHAMRVNARQGAWEATVRLKPENFGDVTIALRVERNTVSAIVQAEAAGVRQWLESQEQAVRSGMAEHGLHLDRFVVNRDGARREAPERQQPDARRRQPRRDAQTAGERFEIVV